ncbi:hypothetical protein SAMN05444409_3913 [Epilithonimonas zeae]|uniref:Lipoprotein n=1 Tax=Epilithonimonas zeae TaxID=1416779 RepID=A0A1N6JW20_9FLAO|nr:hypothetical protein SAMN05444409_3913 [Epilithonimonas zeae]
MIINKVAKFLFCFIFILILSCNSQSVSSSVTNDNINEKPVSKIVYLFFEGEKTSDGKETIKLVDKRVSDGFFKNEEFGTAKDIANTFYKMVLFDKKNQVYKTSIIDNPFSPVFESYGKESMEKQIGKLDKAEFFYRYNDNDNISKLEIHKSENNQSNLIFTLKL